MVRMNERNINLHGESIFSQNDSNILLMRMNSDYNGDNLHINLEIVNPMSYTDKKEWILADIEKFIDGAIETILLAKKATFNEEEIEIEEETPIEEEE